ncbi:hypothetical protein Tco_1429032 [Tanacetum coccineum]
MADKEKKSTMKGLETNDQADYYSKITIITVNENNAYELKGKFLDDLHKNAFSRTNGEDATYDEYKDDWIYEWNKNVPWVHEKPWMENGVWKELRDYIVGNTLRYQDLECYDALKDSELKEEALRNKAIMEGLINEDVESNNEGWKSWDDIEITNSDRNEWEYRMNMKMMKDMSYVVMKLMSCRFALYEDSR